MNKIISIILKNTRNLFKKILWELGKLRFSFSDYYWIYLLILFFWFIFLILVFIVFFFLTNIVYSFAHFLFYFIHLIIYILFIYYLYINKKDILSQEVESDLKFLLVLFLFLLSSIILVHFFLVGLEFWFQKIYCIGVLTKDFSLDQFIIVLTCDRFPAFESIGVLKEIWYLIIFLIENYSPDNSFIQFYIRLIYRFSDYFNLYGPIIDPVSFSIINNEEIFQYIQSHELLQNSMRKYWFYLDKVSFNADMDFIILLHDCLHIITNCVDPVDKFTEFSNLFNNLEKMNSVDDAKIFLLSVIENLINR